MSSPAPTIAGIEAWLAQAVNLERTGEFRDARLDRLQAALVHLPRPPAPCTVTGTKGKGSTVRLIECALRVGGLPTLAFTSPHVHQVCERWRVDGAVVDPAVLAGLCPRVEEAEASIGGRLTYFERTFALAVLLAAQRPQARFLCEVGLGGRLDCANAVDAAVVVLTHLSRDHCQILGDTLDAIAGEKLALCRPGRPLVVAPQSPAGAAAVRARLPADVPVHWVERPDITMALAMPGAHQQDNAATALAALRLFAPEVDAGTAIIGMASARLAARCQVIENSGRRLLIDGAHNAVSIAATMAVAAQVLRPGWRLILGVASDKEIDEIAAVIPRTVVVSRCGYRSPRARRAGDWPAAMQAWPWHDDITTAVAAQLEACDLCVTGSFYLAGEALALTGAAGVLPG